MTSTLWVTGARGFTAGHLIGFVKDLPERPRIVGLDLAEGGPPDLDAYHALDLNDGEAVAAIGRGAPPRWVIHLAGLMPPASETEMWRANVGGTAGLFVGLRSAGCGNTRVVSVGSAAEYLPDSTGPRNETSPAGGTSAYGRTKWAQSALALSIGQECGVSPLVVRTFNLVGPGLPTRFAPAWLCAQFASAADGDEISVGNVESARDFIDVRDAVQAYWLVATRGTAGEVYNVCSGRAVTIKELIALLCSLTRKSPRIRIDPSRQRGSDPPVVYGDYAKLLGATGWRPGIRLERSFADMLS